MNYTEKYHLPQWEETDRVLRTDFNQMCADMEAGLSKTASDAASALSAVRTEAASASANAQNSANTAQATADTAVSKADAARAVADAAYCSSYQPYAVGSYVGPGFSQDIVLELGFRPKFLIISGQIAQEKNYVSYSALVMDGQLPDIFKFRDTGVTINMTYNKPGTGIPDSYVYIYEKGRTYYYIAFR